MKPDALELAVPAIQQPIKMLGRNRVGGYMVLWGGPDARDLDEEYFTRDTEELTTIFDAVGKLPMLYQHAMDSQIKTAPIGVIDLMQPDDLGLWYEAQLDANHQYVGVVRKLIAQRALGTSSGTLPGARKVARDGKILRWPIVEGTATPTPADPRQVLERPIAEIKSAFRAIGLALELPGIEEPGQGAEDARRIAVRLGLLKLMELESSLIGVMR